MLLCVGGFWLWEDFIDLPFRGGADRGNREARSSWRYSPKGPDRQRGSGPALRQPIILDIQANADAPLVCRIERPFDSLAEACSEQAAENICQESVGFHSNILFLAEPVTSTPGVSVSNWKNKTKPKVNGSQIPFGNTTKCPKVWRLRRAVTALSLERTGICVFSDLA